MPLRDQYKQVREQAQAFVKKIEAEGRAELTVAEQEQVSGMLAKAHDLAEQIKRSDADMTLLRQIEASEGFIAAGAKSTDRAGRGFVAGEGGSKSAVKAAWREMAEQLVDTGRATGGLKTLTLTSEPFVAASTVVSDIAVLPEDRRYIFPLISRRDAGTSLQVVDYRLTARADHSGSASVERSPTATTAKATIDRTVEEFKSDMAMMAVILDGIPNAVLNAAPDLSQLLGSELERRLYRALDAHVIGAITDATPPSGVTTTDGTVEQLVRAGITEMQAVGVNPSVVVLNPSDAGDVDTRTFTDAVNRWPYGLRVVVSPDADAGAPLLLDPVELGVLYQGQIMTASDPYAGVSGDNFKTNRVDLRSEFLALMVVRDNLGAFIASPAS